MKKLMKAQTGKIVKSLAKKYAGSAEKYIKKANDYPDIYTKSAFDKYKNINFNSPKNLELKEYKVPNSKELKQKFTKTNPAYVAKSIAKTAGAGAAGAAVGYAAGSKKKMGGSIKSKKK